MALSRRDFVLAGAVGGLAVACGLFGDDDGPERIQYGRAGSQFGDLHLPSGSPRATVVLIHGGSWATEEDLTIVRPVAEDLRREGYAVWNVEYRRVGEDGGGWPGTFEDVGEAIDHVDVLAREHPVDPQRVVVVGHSAGGTLALWAAGRTGVAVRPQGFLALAAITDLAGCVEDGLLPGACAAVVGGTPEEVAGRYQQASPVERLPTGRRQAVLHGVDDDIVPVGQSQRYAEAARAAGDRVELVAIPEAGHFQLIDIRHPAYGQVLTSLNGLLPPV